MSVSSQRARVWELRTRRVEFGDTPKLMGIVNVTPDSFSDGGKSFTPSDAVDCGLRLEDAGADLLDIGGESTRPYSQAVTLDEEMRRVVPVLESLAERVCIPISIDTSKSAVARTAIEIGAEIINDVTGLEGDPEMLGVAADTGAGVCAMHMQGTPQNMQDAPTYADVVEDIYNYLKQRDAALVAAGIQPEKICLDPGIGFGKTHEHNLQLLRQCGQFLRLGRPLLVGHSRKGFIGKLIHDNNAERITGSVGMSLGLARQGVQILRIHDVEATRRALSCFQAAGGLA